MSLKMFEENKRTSNGITAIGKMVFKNYRLPHRILTPYQARLMIQEIEFSGAAMLPKEILQLSTPEKLQLVEDLWNDIALHPDEIRLSPEQEAELDRRLAFHENNPGFGIPWDEIKSKLRPGH